MNRELIWTKALDISRKAVDSAAVIPLKTEKYKSNQKLSDYELRVLKSPIPKYLVEYGPKRNPFIPWDSRLEIQSIYDKHTLILNKYPVQLGHMLLITNNWVAQNGWLNINDFEAIQNVDSDTSGLWFFNSCQISGASQPHRHFQLLPRHSNQKICPRYEWFSSLLNNKDEIISQISHSISIRARKKNSDSKSKDLFNSYKSMSLEMNLGDIKINQKPLQPYNLLITDKWISMIKRTSDRSNGFYINALGFAGYFLGTKNSNIDALIQLGPEKILKEVV